MSARGFMASHLHRLSDATIEVEQRAHYPRQPSPSRRKVSRQPYDYYKLLSTMLGDKTCHPLSASECSRVNVGQ
jgi:hypothetical protein